MITHDIGHSVKAAVGYPYALTWISGMGKF